ncbi:MAG TPA: hypothetical protein VIR81_13150 [Myxococcales bacterium]
MIDVEHAFARHRRLLALLLLLLLGMALLLALLLLLLALLLLRGLLRLGHAVQVLRSGRAFSGGGGLGRLAFLPLRRGRALADVLGGAFVASGVVLHVDDAALRVERRRRLPLSVAALAAAPAATPAIAPELPPALALLLLPLGLAELGIAAVAAAPRLRVARVPRLGCIAPGGLGSSRGGGSLSFSVHP